MQEKSINSVILLPSYQPEETLIVLSKALADHGFKVLIVDDGSGEKFSSIFETCKEWSTVIGYEKNKGKGFALKHGYKYVLDNFSDSECVITADGDGQHRIQDILRVYEKCIERKVPVISERKFDVKVPLKSKLGNDLSRFTQALSTYRYMRDNQCGLRAFPISIIPQMIKIRGDRYEYEMRVITYLQLKEIPYVCLAVKTIYEDGNRTTHFRPILDTLLIQGSILGSGTINFLTFLIGVLTASLFYYFVFKDGGSAPVIIDYELSVLIASPIMLIFHLICSAIIHRPVNFSKTIFRLVLYQLLELISLLITVSFFCRICNFTIFGAYFLCLPLIMFPLYYLTKGIGLVYNSQVE